MDNPIISLDDSSDDEIEFINIQNGNWYLF